MHITYRTFCVLQVALFSLKCVGIFFVFPLNLLKNWSWWRRVEGVLKTPFALVMRGRLQDVFKTSWSRPICSSCSYIFKNSSIHFQDVLTRHLHDIFKKFSRRLVKTSSKHLWGVSKMFWRTLQGVFKMFSRHIQDIFKTSCKDVFKMFSRPIIKLNCSCEHVFETYFTYFWDELHRRLSTENLVRSHVWKTYGQWKKFARVISVLIC